MLSLGILPRPRPPKSEYTVKEVRALLMARPPPPPPSPPVYAAPPEESELPCSASECGEDAGCGGSGGGGASSAAPRYFKLELPIVNQCSMFEELKGSLSSWGIDSLGTLVVEVELLSGVIGVGVSVGGAPACFLVEEHLSRFVEGQDVRNIEFIWEQMYRSCQCYGSQGLTMHALSAIDLALWDALGKARNEPVYNLLGGKTKEMLPICATSLRPDFAHSLGFRGCKLPLPFGPADGAEGMRKNIEHLKRVRAVVGSDFPIALDCFMALTVPYAMELAQRCAREVPGGVLWLEEPFAPGCTESMAEVKAKVGHLVQLASGEHEHSLKAFHRLLEGKCVDIVQPDVTKAGGISEVRRIIALARAYDVPVVLHAASSFAFHVQFAFTNCPFGEMLLLGGPQGALQPQFCGLFVDEPQPDASGYLRLSDRPGFGLTVNKSLRLLRPYSRVPASYEEIEAVKDQRTPTPRQWLAVAERSIPLGSPFKPEEA